MKRKRVVLSLQKKMELIEKMEVGWSIVRISSEYGVHSNTLYDIRKGKDKIRNANAELVKTSKNEDRKIIRQAKYSSVDEATLLWFRQQRAAGVVVRGTELQNAAQKFARLHEEHDFKASEGWLFWFKLRHGLSNKRTHGEALDANEESVEEFRTKFTELI